MWSELQIQFSYGITRRELKKDLCKRVTFSLGYMKSEKTNLEPGLSENESHRSRFGSSVRQLRLASNLKKEKDVVLNKFGFLANPEKNNEMHKLFTETTDSIRQRIDFSVDSLCEIIKNASEDDKAYFQKYLTDANCLKPLSKEQQASINSSFIVE